MTYWSPSGIIVASDVSPTDKYVPETMEDEPSLELDLAFKATHSWQILPIADTDVRVLSGHLIVQGISIDAVADQDVAVASTLYLWYQYVPDGSGWSTLQTGASLPTPAFSLHVYPIGLVTVDSGIITQVHQLGHSDFITYDHELCVPAP